MDSCSETGYVTAVVCLDDPEFYSGKNIWADFVYPKMYPRIDFWAVVGTWGYVSASVLSGFMF